MKIHILIELHPDNEEIASFVGYTRNEKLAMAWIKEDLDHRGYETVYEYKAPAPEPLCGCGKPPIRKVVNETGEKLLCKSCLNKNR